MQTLNTIKQMTGLNEHQLVKYGLIALCSCVLFGFAERYIVCLIGVGFPVLKSFHTLVQGDEAEEKQWLTYWVVFGAFSVFDHFAGWILYFIPFFFVIKLAFLIWLMHPRFRGATFVYDQYLREAVKPLDRQLNEVEAKISEGINQIGRNVSDAASDLKDKVTGGRQHIE